jgi:2-dehydropantoate 2-reductase
MSSILIVGTGAMASLFAGRLAKVGLAVTLLGTWQKAIDALNEHGVRFENGESYPVFATNNVTECAGISHVLILTKAWQTPRVAHQLSHCLPPHGLAITLQNGLGNNEMLAEQLGLQRVAVGTATMGATLVAPGVVRDGGTGTLTFAQDDRLADLLPILRQAGFHIIETADLDSVLWGKLVINAGINPLTAILQVPNGELLTRPTARNLMQATATETTQVAHAHNITLPYPDPIVAVEEVAHKTASNHSSMFQDIKRHAPTEIDAICGTIIKIGKQVGVPTPINQTLFDLVKAIVA